MRAPFSKLPGAGLRRTSVREEPCRAQRLGSKRRKEGLPLSLPLAPFAPPPPPPPRDGVGAGRGKSAEPSSVHPHAGAAFLPLPGNTPAALPFLLASCRPSRYSPSVPITFRISCSANATRWELAECAGSPFLKIGTGDPRRGGRGLLRARTVRGSPLFPPRCPTARVDLASSWSAAPIPKEASRQERISARPDGDVAAGPGAAAELSRQSGLSSEGSFPRSPAHSPSLPPSFSALAVAAAAAAAARENGVYVSQEAVRERLSLLAPEGPAP